MAEWRVTFSVTCPTLTSPRKASELLLNLSHPILNIHTLMQRERGMCVCSPSGTDKKSPLKLSRSSTSICSHKLCPFGKDGKWGLSACIYNASTEAWGKVLEQYKAPTCLFCDPQHFSKYKRGNSINIFYVMVPIGPLVLLCIWLNL